MTSLFDKQITEPREYIVKHALIHLGMRGSKAAAEKHEKMLRGSHGDEGDGEAAGGKDAESR